MSDKQQAVAGESEDSPKAEAEGAGAQEKDDIDSYLNQFDEGTAEKSDPKPEPGKDKSDPKPEVDEKIVDLAVQRIKADQQFENDIKSTITVIRGDLDAKRVKDSFVRSWLDEMAKEHPKLRDAWLQRHEKPDAWSKAQSKLAEEFQGVFSPHDKDVTEDRAAVSAAVRGASTKAPEPDEPSQEDLMKMSDSEYEQYVKGLRKRMGKG